MKHYGTSGARDNDGLTRRFLIALTVLLLGIATIGRVPADTPAFRFVILGDRTGEVQAGVYEGAWREAAGANPAFVVSTGDMIQGLNELTAEKEWEEEQAIRKPYAKIPLYLVPGNHDIWSNYSEKLYKSYSGHPLHYGFDLGPVHFTMLDNSRSDDLPVDEMSFLEQDLKAHASQPLKVIVSHRPSWILQAAIRSTGFPLHRLAKQYGVQYVIAGHVHQLLHIDLDGVTYLSMPSSGGHLRASGKYEDGWFFGYALADVQGTSVKFQIQELSAPHGRGRTTALSDWGMLGLAR